jgi:hypothetical protein
MKLVQIARPPYSYIADNPFRAPGGLGHAPLACIVNGYFSLFYACCTGGNPSHSTGAVLYSWDEIGNVCIYHTADFINANPLTHDLANADVVKQSGNAFLFSFVGNSTIYKFVVPNVFRAGITYVLPPSSLAIPAPCPGGAYNSTIFLGQQKLIAYEFIQDFALATNYWASIYDEQGAFKGGGFIANYPNPFDPFDRTQSVLPPTVFTTYYKNGMNVYGNFGSAPSASQVIGWDNPYLNGDPSQLVCGGSGNLDVYCAAINQFQSLTNNIIGVSFVEGPQSIALGISDIYNTFAFPDTSFFYLFSKDYAIQIPAFNSSNQAVCFMSKTKKLYVQYIDHTSPQDFSGNIFVMDLNLSGYGASPIVTKSSYKGLANYHRAVSPSGSFQA